MLQLKPNVIFSAHDHRVAMATTRKNDSHYFEVGSFVDDSTVIKKQINDQDCTEVIWPTCSYRMGVVKSGYGFATIGNYSDTLKIEINTHNFGYDKRK